MNSRSRETGGVVALNHRLIADNPPGSWELGVPAAIQWSIVSPVEQLDPNNSTRRATSPHLRQAGGLIAISRWLSGATPPVNTNALRVGVSDDARRVVANLGEVVRAGIEPATHGFSVCTDDQFSKQKTAFSPQRAAPGAAVGAESQPIDPELAQLIAAWPSLPDPIRRGILAMVQAAGGNLYQ